MARTHRVRPSQSKKDESAACRHTLPPQGPGQNPTLWMRLQAGNIRRLYEETTSVNASFPTPWPYRRRRAPSPPQATCCGWPGCPRGRNRTTYLQACHALWAVCEMGWTQTNTAFVLGINQTTEIPVHPIQTHQQRRGAVCPQAVTLRAYEVYCHIHSPQEALVTGGCRGGFSTGELIAFLYASGFPKAEWRRRVDEAFKGAVGL